LFDWKDEGRALALKKRRFWHNVFLNAEGKKLFGEVFPDGLVPVVSMIPGVAVIGGVEERIYLVFHEEMSEDQIARLSQLLAGVFGAPEVAVKAELLKNRIPLRAKYTDGAASNALPMFI